MSTNSVQPLPGQQVIHVAKDPDTDLEALFNAVLNPRPSSWRKKHLPESFFKEPDSGSHSRQSSTDSGSQQPPRLPPQHVRSHSSPASLQLRPAALAAASAAVTASPVQHAHSRHQSFDVTDELPLPPGWEMAYTSTGQKYFLNHVEKITTWQDPRKTLVANMNQMSLHAQATSNNGGVQGRSMALSQPNLVMSQHQHHLQHAQHQQQQQQQVQAQSQALGSGGSMPHQQSSQSAMMGMGNPLSAQQQHQQKIRLQRIQLERERIQRRHEELRRQEVALCRQIPMDSDNMANVAPTINPAAMNQGTVPTSSSDPFLNSGPYHSREQSTDSGLGLGCYSIPTTPEDFLNNMEEMDTGDNMVPVNMNVPQQSRFPDFLDSMPGTNVDLGTLDGTDLMPILNDVESVLNKNEPFLTWL
ncbi:WW domain-containing transcription regulator protein 1 isoform X2 [Tachysurus fulvidraco]|uniref:WW domain-containing transcription regulator protein 1 isoform X2 n=1 Tax=Tachysurus fulvidraco TaxID=1234273 RepID=UPI000F50560A|nr:WW domain-containing transcription regulator protein 1 isoform X2 [Tachysurus fulvidraco]